MINPGKSFAWLASVLIILSLIVLPAETGAFEKKLRVSADYTRIYLQPDDDSPVIATLERGHILSLLYSGKMRKTNISQELPTYSFLLP